MQLFKELKWYFKKEIKRYVVAILLLILISILQIFPPKIVGILIDSLLKKEIHGAQTLPLITLMLVIAIIIYILRCLWRIFLFGAAYKLTMKLRIKIYNYLSQQNQHFFLQNRIGDLITKITSDVDKVVFSAGEGVLTLVDSLVMGLSILIVMIIQIDWKLTTISLIPLPIMTIIIKKFGKKLHFSFRKSQIAFSNLNNYTQESLSNISMIKSFGLEQYHKKKFFKLSQNVGKKNINVSKIDAKFDPVIHMSIALSNLLAITFGSWMISQQKITIGQLTSFIMYLGLMIWPMLALAWMFNIIERGTASWNRIKSIIIDNTKTKKLYKKIPPFPQKLKININYFNYKKNAKKILTNINFILKPGQILGICGPTGSGKSTLIKLIQRQLEVSNGTILYDNIPISKFNITDWRKKITVVDQTTFLFSDSILNNITLGRPNASKEDIETASYLANLHHDILIFPKGYQTQVGEKGTMLSGGQKQRVSIARALLLKSEILILDNALSSVDNSTEHTILNNFFYKWKQNKTSIIICTHRLSSLIDADLIVVIKNGRIIQSGTHYSLIKEKKKWYRNTYYFQKNFKKYDVNIARNNV